MTEIEEGLFHEFCKTFNSATEKGLSQSENVDIEQAFRDALRHNNAVFSAFKVHRMQNDMAALMMDSSGNLKPFEKWRNDVQPIASHQCRHWLKTEYNTAVRRAHMAADWKQFEQEKDIFPNLKWKPSTSPDPGKDHQVYWNMVRPIDDPFWDEHRPGDRWNCHCAITSTRDAVTPIPNVPQTSADRPHTGLDNNPAKDGKIFSDSHPYIANASKQAKNVVRKFVAEQETKTEKWLPIRTYDNGGQLFIHPDVEKNKPDYKAILTICRQLAEQGHIVRITPRVHFKSPLYKEIYGALMGTIYERKCPDFSVDGIFYEFEGFEKPWKKKKVGRMIGHGMKQSSRIVIDNNHGATDRFIRKAIIARLHLPNQEIDEIWLYEKGKARLFFKDGKFY